MRIKSTLKLVDHNMAKVFAPWILRHPKYLFIFKKLVSSFKNSKELRSKAKAEGYLVPPFMILSITKQCNLHCAGCYAAAAGTLDIESKLQLNIEEWRSIIKEANDLGVFAYIIAGGEPFLFPGLLELSKEFSDRLFLIFTNGTAIRENDFKRLKKLKNTGVIVSLEGDREATDFRRGVGVYEKALDTLKRLNKIGVLNGISVTINGLNYEHWMNPQLIDSLIKKGIRIGFFLEYIPSKKDITSSLMLTEQERKLFRAKILEYRANKKIYLIHSPGDEELLGGCVSAGRGFAHITPSGDLTPCPVSNIATHNLKTSTLEEGLKSQFFKKIRENEHLLETEGVPCALYAHKEEVEELARSVGGYFIHNKEKLIEIKQVKKTQKIS
ncbi:MAG: radical SAM protein [Candidatus Lokiarchaeota archaeon]|nr:radical SAM protein [Candidatus Lokiarchaeota archaeon]